MLRGLECYKSELGSVNFITEETDRIGIRTVNGTLKEKKEVLCRGYILRTGRTGERINVS